MARRRFSHAFAPPAAYTDRDHDEAPNHEQGAGDGDCHIDASWQVGQQEKAERHTQGRTQERPDTSMPCHADQRKPGVTRLWQG
jgi:hypothetical protein